RFNKDIYTQTSASSGTSEEREILNQTEYPVDDIINEKTVNGEKKYLIKWKPIHGREFMDTWEPAEYANALAVRDWELIKMKKAQWKKKRTKKAVEVTSQQSREPSPIHRHQQAYQRTNAEPTSDSTLERSFRPTVRYAAQPFQIVAVSPEPVPNPVLSASQPSAHIAVAPEAILNDASEPAPGPAQKGVGNYWGKGKHPTQAQQRARMREKREVKRAAKAERLANMTEKERADAAHSKAMHNKSKKERRRTKAERYAALPQEEKDRLDSWLAWKRGLRERTKEDKRRAKANKARRMEAAAQNGAGRP
ncbi:hypothetical protein KCV01_g190, partial [Aureobasidium melanogenum]